MKSIVANVAEAIGIVLTFAAFALFALACLTADDYSAPEIPSAMQNWNGGAK